MFGCLPASCGRHDHPREHRDAPFMLSQRSRHHFISGQNCGRMITNLVAIPSRDPREVAEPEGRRRRQRPEPRRSLRVFAGLWEPRADQFPDRSRQRPGRSSRRLVERDRLFERGYALLLRVVFRREGCEHGFDAGLPSAIRGSRERSHFSLEAFETVQVLICVGFLVWLIVSLLSSRREKGSVDYLNELYGSLSGTSKEVTNASVTIP
jgi:hypothetical protein